MVVRNTTYRFVGTYLISFYNEAVTIDDSTFISMEISLVSPLPAVLQLSENKCRIEQVLSLEMTKEIKTKNVDTISTISTSEKIIFSLNLTLLAVLVF